MISIISCISKNGVIGRNGKLPWHYSFDLKRFKELTINQTILFGRKTYESLPKELNERKIIVLTKDKNYNKPNIKIKHSHEEILDNFLENKEKLFICGGGEIYRLFIDYASEVYLTVIDKEYEGDVFFPIEKMNRFQIRNLSTVVENGVLLNFIHYSFA